MSDIRAAGLSPQPMRALEFANHVRRARSELKTRVAGGEVSAGELILTCPREIAGMPVAQLLASQRGWGEVRSRALLSQIAVRADKAVGSLTERQRRAVASQLARADVGHEDRRSPTTPGFE